MIRQIGFGQLFIKILGKKIKYSAFSNTFSYKATARSGLFEYD